MNAPSPLSPSPIPADAVVVGIDVGGTKTNATVLDTAGRFLVERMVEVPSLVRDGTAPAIQAVEDAVIAALAVAEVDRRQVIAVGLDTPGPSTATGVLSTKGGTNFSGREWWGFDIRTAVEDHLQLPVIYNNDGNAAALYAHNSHFGAQASSRCSISAIVGTGLGGGVIDFGRVIVGATGMAGELGHVHIPMEGLLEDGQPQPRCNCGFHGDLESIASLSGITNNLLPYWLTRYPNHPLTQIPIAAAAKEVRTYGEQGDEMALHIFRQQAMAIGRMFTISSNFTDPHCFFVGGGVIEAEPLFRAWFLGMVREHTLLRDEQRAVVEFSVVTDLDMAGARGSAQAALEFLGLMQ